MDAKDILRFRSLSRCFPGAPFAKATPQVGCSSSAGGWTPSGGGGSSPGPGVKVLALLCSSGGIVAEPSRKRSRSGSDGDAAEGATGVEDANQPPPRRQRHLYVRVQYDKTLVETLPVEVMRERHPQVLIDYLLSCSVWS